MIAQNEGDGREMLIQAQCVSLSRLAIKGRLDVYSQNGTGGVTQVSPGTPGLPAVNNIYKQR